MIYFLAKEKLEFSQPRIIETNCIDKIHGHSYRWVKNNSEENKEIISQHPSFKGIGIAICTKCNKVQSSH